MINPTERPLPQSREFIADPLLAFEEPKKIPKGKISLRQFGVILDSRDEKDPKLHQAECISKEYDIDIHETMNLLTYYEKIKLEDVAVVVKEGDNIKWTMDLETDIETPPKKS